jgi:hypothetical protein
MTIKLFYLIVKLNCNEYNVDREILKLYINKATVILKQKFKTDEI